MQFLLIFSVCISVLKSFTMHFYDANASPIHPTSNAYIIDKGLVDFMTFPSILGYLMSNFVLAPSEAQNLYSLVN